MQIFVECVPPGEDRAVEKHDVADLQGAHRRFIKGGLQPAHPGRVEVHLRGGGGFSSEFALLLIEP